MAARMMRPRTGDRRFDEVWRHLVVVEHCDGLGCERVQPRREMVRCHYVDGRRVTADQYAREFVRAFGGVLSDLDLEG